MKLMVNKVLVAQGIYYSLTALWPLVHIESFMFITGPKHDIWLVKTVGILLLCSGISFMISGCGKNRPENAILFLALSEAIGMTYVDTYYSLTDTISSIYLADAIAEIILIMLIIIYYPHNLHSNDREKKFR
ncbi:MAG TPA: hypothetical protein VF868_11900 [Bacteroidia bacterium]|jgi:hypothetical protein